ncbi:methyltransferase domain-containing protein [Thiorhodococcus mannitoliphagus]|uniref:Methyltransferase domain-containing protein n=1 Tax=Thiorhodococcus mannitoliphagus TaxID=329406 RepID=A0A6P1E068_9GAMM|nr:PqqD family peptide modification chaperone [Thiorhodococcus mannitoliphagus]NEX22681.1 methyltransferase domain-containing protein [Thiorhodococcus mannitoliphagus]
MLIPRLKSSLFTCPGEEGLLAYDSLSDRVHRLNPVASLICELCDGRRSVEEIASIVAPLLPEDQRRQTEELIMQVVEAGLLETSPAPAPMVDAAGLAKQLRAQDKLEAAYICQFHAAERDPEDANLWATLGELSHILGRREQARAAYERCLSLRPYDAEVRHLLIALRDEQAPPRADNDCIQQLYERFSSFYESNMLEELDYQAPQRLAALIAELMGERAGLEVLELGCGSGLAGAEIRGSCAHLTGIDLSSHMLDLARERGIYDALEQAEISAWLQACEGSFDLILACDSLIYFGDLREVMAAAASRLAPDGLFVFSLEFGEAAPYRLNDNGRYSHHPEPLRALATDCGLEVARLEQGYLRMEYGAEVEGLFVALRPAGRE